VKGGPSEVGKRGPRSWSGEAGHETAP
jgi:hypothetical protein